MWSFPAPGTRKPTRWLTGIEVSLRKALWAKGYRYRKNVRDLPGKPDIVMSKYKLVIFCDSEFFHGKDWENGLKDQLLRGNNSEFWINKISRNIERDSRNNALLVSAGWTVLRFWGKEIEKDLDGCVKKSKTLSNHNTKYRKL